MTQNYIRALGAALFALSLSLGGQVIADAAVSNTETVVSPDPAFDARVRDVFLRNPEILLEVFALLEDQQGSEEAAADLELIASVSADLFAGLDPSRPMLVEFQDYNCGYCRRAHADVTTLKADHPDLQLAVLEFPILGQGSAFAAKAALALKSLKGEAAYARFSDGLMLLDGTANAASVLQLLNAQGHDGEAIIAAANEGAGADGLERAAKLARALGITGTPTFVGPGGIIRGAAIPGELHAIATAPDDTTDPGEEVQHDG